MRGSILVRGPIFSETLNPKPMFRTCKSPTQNPPNNTKTKTSDFGKSLSKTAHPSHAEGDMLLTKEQWQRNKLFEGL